MGFIDQDGDTVHLVMNTQETVERKTGNSTEHSAPRARVKSMPQPVTNQSLLDEQPSRSYRAQNQPQRPPAAKRPASSRQSRHPLTPIMEMPETPFGNRSLQSPPGNQSLQSPPVLVGPEETLWPVGRVVPLGVVGVGHLGHSARPNPAAPFFLPLHPGIQCDSTTGHDREHSNPQSEPRPTITREASPDARGDNSPVAPPESTLESAPELQSRGNRRGLR